MMSATETLEELRVILSCPEGESILLYAKDKVVLMSDLAFAVRMDVKDDDFKWPGYIKTSVFINPAAPRYVLYQGQSIINEAIHRSYVMMDYQDSQAGKSNIITNGNGNSRLQ